MTPEQIMELCIKITEEAGEKINEIGEQGLKKVDVDNRVNHAILADKVVSQLIREKFSEIKFPGIIKSEEGKDVDFSEGAPRYLIICDEIDGSENLMSGKGMQPFCTILCVFDAINPKFDDALVSVIRIHTTGHIFYAVRNRGCYIKNPTGKIKKITTSKQIEFKRRIKLRFDTFRASKMDTKQIKNLITKTWIKDFGSTGYHLATVAAGMADAFVNYGAKGEELGAGYLLVKEAEGSMIDFNGSNIGKQKFSLKKSYQIITAATPELANTILHEMNKNEPKASFI